MKFTFYGHACFMVEAGGKKLLFDPFISPNGMAAHIDINSIAADYILLSHGHADHVADLVAIAKNTGAMVICMAEIAQWCGQQGLTKVHGMNYGAYTFDFGEVRMLPAAHSSGLPDGSYGGNPAGFVIKTKDGNFYYSGDTCLIMDMQLVPRFAKIDFAVMPIGGNFTMNAEDAAIAAEFVEVTKVVGIHYDTFPPIQIDKAAAQAAFTKAHRQLLLPEIGETINL